MPTVIYLIRHGAPVARYDDQGRALVYGPDAPLSPEGRRQVIALADKIRTYGSLDVLYTSDYVRAFETAMILAGHMNISRALVDKRLADTRAHGWVGVPIEELARLGSGGLFRDPRTEETAGQIDARMWAAFTEIMAQAQGKTIGLVGHGDPFRILYWRIHHPHAALPDMDEIAQHLNLGMARASRLMLDGNGAVIETALI